MEPELIRVTKKFTFETAHSLLNHDGPCKNIHGHSYKLSVTIIGTPLHQSNHPKNGMIIDFGDLKKLVHEAVVNDYDHALILSENHPSELIKEMKEQHQKLIVVPFQPSCELLILDIKTRIQNKIQDYNFNLHSLKLEETASSFAEWYASDN